MKNYWAKYKNNVKAVGWLFICVIVTLIVGLPWQIANFVLERIVDILNGVTSVFQGSVNLMEKGKHQVYLKVIRPSLENAERLMQK